jgi:hypothetical protein
VERLLQTAINFVTPTEEKMREMGKHRPLNPPEGGIRCPGGVSNPTNTDPWTHQRSK